MSAPPRRRADQGAHDAHGARLRRSPRCCWCSRSCSSASSPATRDGRRQARRAERRRRASVAADLGIVGATGEYRHRTLAPAVLVAPDRARLCSPGAGLRAHRAGRRRGMGRGARDRAAAAASQPRARPGRATTRDRRRRADRRGADRGARRRRRRARAQPGGRRRRHADLAVHPVAAARPDRRGPAELHDPAGGRRRRRRGRGERRRPHVDRGPWPCWSSWALVVQRARSDSRRGKRRDID